MIKIPFSKNTFDQEEEKAVIDCLRSGWVVLGPKTQEFEEKFAEYVGAKYAVAVDSGTSALFLAIKAVDYKYYISIPSLTFVSDAEVIYHCRMNINFVDIDRKTLCVDKTHEGMNLLPVNFAGVKAEGNGKVIDSCHRIERNDVKDSNSLWCYSFYATKNLNCVQGGMIALNDKEKYEWLLLARDHGTSKGTMQRYHGRNPVYDIMFPGWRTKPDDVRSSIGLVQLKKLPAITQRRNEIVKRYNKNLGLNNTGNHLYPILVEEREEFINKLYDAGIQCSIHFLPIHKFSAYKDESVWLPTTNFVCDRIVSIPMFPGMTDEEVDIVSDKVLETKLLIK